MSPYNPPKNVKEFFSEHNRRTIFIFGFCLLLIGLLMGRMYYIQVIKHDYYSTEADDNRIQVKAIPPLRGKIFDRNGKILADNTIVYNLGIVVEHTHDLDRLLAEVKKLILITENDLEKFKKSRHHTRAHNPVLLKRKLTDTEVARISVNSYHLKGAVILTQYSRFYIDPEEYAHVIGYVGRISKKELESLDQGNYRATTHIGKIGVEKYYESILHGTAGRHTVETNVEGKIIRTLSKVQPTAGVDLYLTIDAGLQKKAFELMRGKRGSVVAIEPSTFDVLAMVSTPSYDTNLFVNGISHKDYSVLRGSIDRPLINRSIGGRYPPGSTLKPFMGLAGLENGVVKENSGVKCVGFYRLKDSRRKFRDWKKYGHGNTSMNKALAESCDVYFYNLAFKLGIDRIKPYLDLFYFGRRTGVDLPYEISGFIPSREWQNKKRNLVWNPGETLNVGVGQGLAQTSPLQLAYATAVLANWGKSYPPTILYRLQNVDSSVIDNVVNYGAELNFRINLDKENIEKGARVFARDQRTVPMINIRNWKTIIRGMKNVVHSGRGTARNVADTRYDMAGKTGTAQVIGIAQDEIYDEDKIKDRFHDHALFVAFAPVKKPKIAIAVIVENGKHGSTTAAPIAKELIDKYLEDIGYINPRISDDNSLE